MISRIRRLFAALPPVRQRDVRLTLVLMCSTALADAGAIFALADTIGRLTVGNAASSQALAFIAFIGVSGLLRVATTYMTQRVGNLASRDLVIRAHRNWIDQPYSFHLQRHSVELLAAPERIDQAVFGLLLPAMQILAALLSATAVLVAVVAIDGAAALAVLGMLIIVFGSLGVALRGYLQRKGSDANAAYGQRTKVLQESHAGIRDIILDRSQTRYGRRLEGAADALARAALSTAWVGALPRQMIETGGIIAVLLLTVYLSGEGGGLEGALPTLGALALAGQRLLPAIQQIFQGWATATIATAIVDDALSLAELTSIAQSNDAATPAFNRSIELRSVSFVYPGLHTAVVKEISLKLTKGQRLVITGSSGAGKSTLADLIMGLLTPTQGTIAVDDTACTPGALQRLVSHVPQTPHFADERLSAVIAGSLPAEPDRVARAVRLANLDDVIARLDDGLETTIGEHGVRLSGGERQRIALARAIYRQAPLLVLDEATNAVDDEAERHILDSLDQIEAEGVTILIIAHRGGALSRGGQHINIEHGRIVDQSVQLTPRLEHQH